MSSFNKVEKVKYTAPGQVGIVLLEYMTFKNEEDNEQYILLKLKNLLTQKVTKFSFKIHEYDESGFMLGESEINYDIVADADEAFIPKAKLKVNPNCKRIDYTLLYALFENIEYKDGEFKQLPFSLEEFRKEKTVEEYIESKIPVDKKALRRQRRADRKIQKIENKARLKRTKKIIKGKVFTVKDVTKMTKVKGPKIFAFINVLFIALGVMIISYVYGKNSTLYTVDYIDYTINSDQVSVTASDSNLPLEETKVNIPATITIGEKTYSVTAVGENAFRNTSIDTVTFNDDIIIGKSAFENCSKLATIVGANNVIYVSESAFKGCTCLTDVSLLNASVIENNAFLGCNNLSRLYAPYAKLYTLSLDGCMNLTNLYIYNTFPESIYKLFTEEADKTKVPSSLNIYLTYVHYGEEFLYQLNAYKLYSFDPSNQNNALLEEGEGTGVDNSGVINVPSSSTDVTITSEVTKINESLRYLASNCPSLVSLHIEAESFSDQIDESLLTNLNIQEFGMKYDLNLSSNFLYNFPNLSTLYLYNSGLTMNYNIPTNVNTLKIDYVSGGSMMTDIYMTDFSNMQSESIKNIIVISGQLQYDSLSAFYNLESLTMNLNALRLEELGVSRGLNNLSITSDGISIHNDFAVEYHSLTTVTINGNPEAIEMEAFLSCYGLTRVNLNVTDTHIYSHVFVDCPNLQEYNIIIAPYFVGTIDEPITDTINN